MSHNSKNLRKAFSQFVTGVTVITTRSTQGAPLGVTVNSFSSVSLDSALVLWCLGDQTWRLEDFLQANHYAVNILSESQSKVSDNFATPGDFDRFECIDCKSGINGVPLIEDCCATLECKRHKLLREGDHWIFFCTIETVSYNDRNPLLYHASEYKKLGE